MRLRRLKSAQSVAGGSTCRRLKIDRQHRRLHNHFCLKANLGISPLLRNPVLGRPKAFPILTLLLVLGGADSLIAQTAPAVSEINGKAGYVGGTMDGSEGTC
jgi:hypothetical protein